MQVFKEEEEAIKVDLHEGCGRTKLFWIMALADSKTLKAMVEFREGKGTYYAMTNSHVFEIKYSKTQSYNHSKNTTTPLLNTLLNPLCLGTECFPTTIQWPFAPKFQPFRDSTYATSQ